MCATAPRERCWTAIKIGWLVVNGCSWTAKLPLGWTATWLVVNGCSWLGARRRPGAAAGSQCRRQQAAAAAASSSMPRSRGQTPLYRDTEQHYWPVLAERKMERLSSGAALRLQASTTAAARPRRSTRVVVDPNGRLLEGCRKSGSTSFIHDTSQALHSNMDFDDAGTTQLGGTFGQTLPLPCASADLVSQALPFLAGFQARRA